LNASRKSLITNIHTPNATYGFFLGSSGIKYLVVQSRHQSEFPTLIHSLPLP
jgi:hypothetical protein